MFSRQFEFRLVTALSASIALAGCNPPLDCGSFLVERNGTCACPDDTMFIEEPPSCRLMDGGIVPLGDGGADAGADAGELPDDASDGCVLRAFFADTDGDGAGDPASSVRGCTAASGYVENDEDCDDTCATCRPGAVEVCDALDNDCEGGVDEGVLITSYVDADSDGFGDPAMAMQSCATPAGHVPNDDDCNDACVTCRPGGAEACDVAALDEDCDGNPNEGCMCPDGSSRACPGGTDVGECVAGTQACTGGAWGACVSAVGPATEICNGRDDDCDSAIDGPVAAASCGTPPRSASTGCSSGSCRVTSCVANWRDCDSNFGNGCETQLGTLSACTGCGEVCGWDCEATGCNDIVEIATGSGHACAIREDGTVVCWGRNDAGQLGNGTMTPSTTPVPVSLPEPAVSISAGSQHSCAVLGTSRTVRCWGANSTGQLGSGGTSASSIPVPVTGGSDALSVHCGNSHTCMLTTGGTVACWGLNSSGQLGDNSTTQRNAATLVVGVSSPILLGAVAVAAGWRHTCAVLSDRTTICWGMNDSGELGNGPATSSSPRPVVVTGLSDAVSITAGLYHSCARLSTGGVRCWGANASGQLGNGGTSMSRTPMAVSSITSATAIDAGGNHTCATLSDGSVRCWGSDSSGQLGDGGLVLSTAYSTMPVTATGLAATDRVSGGAAFSCSRISSGQLFCWGDNFDGQLGDRSTATRSSPVTVLPP